MHQRFASWAIRMRWVAPKRTKSNHSKLWQEAVKWTADSCFGLSFLKFFCFKSQKSRVWYTEHNICYKVHSEQCAVQMDRNGGEYAKIDSTGFVSSAMTDILSVLSHYCTINSNVLIPCIIAKPL